MLIKKKNLNKLAVQNNKMISDYVTEKQDSDQESVKPMRMEKDQLNLIGKFRIMSVNICIPEYVQHCCDTHDSACLGSESETFEFIFLILYF